MLKDRHKVYNVIFLIITVLRRNNECSSTKLRAKWIIRKKDIMTISPRSLEFGNC